MTEPDPFEGLREDPARFRRRLALAIALRHPPTATWATLTDKTRGRMAPAPGGWARSKHLHEWDAQSALPRAAAKDVR